jgi:hypothetical protein
MDGAAAGDLSHDGNTMNTTPEITVIVEWENVLLSEKQRSELMLARLSEQARALNRSVEVIVVCDPAGADLAGLRSLLTERLGPADDASLPWRLISAPGLHYYEIKNRGAAEARGQIVIMLDSDVIPDAGWLAELVNPFDGPAVAVVAGNTYLDPQGLYSRAFALGWIFPRRSETPARHDGGTHFWANNVAFRREVFARNPFPAPDDGSTRGACADLADFLRGQGIHIWETTAAQVSHPPPNGLQHFLARAVAEGRDWGQRCRRAGKPRWRLPYRGLRHYFKATRRAFISTARYRRTVGLALILVPAAWGIMGTYYGLAWLAVLATSAAPGPMSRGFRI